jgi:hypothetical protein
MPCQLCEVSVKCNIILIENVVLICRARAEGGGGLSQVEWAATSYMMLLRVDSSSVHLFLNCCCNYFVFLSFLVAPLTTCKIASASHQGKKKDNICIMGYKFQISYKANFNLCPNLLNSYAVGKILILSFCFFLSEYPTVQANHSNLIPHT